MLPFTTEEFFEVFARYNTVIWPAQIGAAALGLFALILLFRSGPVGSRVISLILAAFWLLMGIGYHLLFFTRINTLAYAFGLLFVAQVVLLFVDGVIRRQIMFRAEPGWRTWLAWSLIAYGLVIYPLIGLFGSHPYPSTVVAHSDQALPAHEPGRFGFSSYLPFARLRVNPSEPYAAWSASLPSMHALSFSSPRSLLVGHQYGDRHMREHMPARATKDELP